MAADTEVIKEFLVSLGFHVDETGLKKMVGGLGQTDKAAAVAGKAVLGIAVAAEAMVVQFSSSMEKLYYQSKRTGSSVENLQALEFGSQKIGLAAGSAREALEGMTSALRMNPGLRGFVDGLLAKDTSKMQQTEVMLELVQKLSDMPHFQGAQYAQMFGMDEKTFLMLKDGLPELIKAEKERIDLNRQAGIDAQAAAEASKEYANSIRDITVRVGVLRDKLAIELLPTFRAFNHQVIESLDAASHLTADDFQPKYIKGFAKEKWGDVKETWRDVKSGVKQKWADYKADVRAGNYFGRKSDAPEQRFPGFIPPTAPSPAPSATPAPEKLPRGMRNNNPGNMRAWAPGQEKRDGFVVFPTMQSGLSAMAAQLLKYQTAGGLNNVRDIVSKWAPKDDRFGRGDHNETDAYVAAVSQRLGVGAGDKLDLKDPQTLSHLMGAMIRQEQGYTPFGSAELLAAANSRTGGTAAPSVTVNQKTDIHVGGGESPRETAREVALVQDETNGNLVRNMRGIVQ